MNIALISHERKRNLLIRFCEAYCTVLKKHTLFSTEDFGNMISSVVGKSVSTFLKGNRGGYQQIAAKIACNEIDLLVFLKDPFIDVKEETREGEVERLCDLHAVPSATNIATAEAVILGLERGDLDWRNVMNSDSLSKLDKLKSISA